MCTLEDEIKRGCSKKQVNICATEKKNQEFNKKIKKKKKQEGKMLTFLLVERLIELKEKISLEF